MTSATRPEHDILADPELFMRVESLELRARGIVEGFLNGLHRSPYVGFSAEFSAHRKYVAGDDPRHVNWKLYARHKRLYMKEYDAETNFRLHLLVDVSRSMSCASLGISKYDYATTLAAALAYLALRQHDAVGLTLFADRVIEQLPPRNKPGQFHALLKALTLLPSEAKSNLEYAFRQASKTMRSRGLVAVFSDLFDEPERLFGGLAEIKFHRHEVLLFHILDPWERRLPPDETLRFRDLESGVEMVADAGAIRDAYNQRFASWETSIEDRCRQQRITRIPLTTDAPLVDALVTYLVQRAQLY